MGLIQWIRKIFTSKKQREKRISDEMGRRLEYEFNAMAEQYIQERRAREVMPRERVDSEEEAYLRAFRMAPTFSHFAVPYTWSDDIKPEKVKTKKIPAIKLTSEDIVLTWRDES